MKTHSSYPLTALAFNSQQQPVAPSVGPIMLIVLEFQALYWKSLEVSTAAKRSHSQLEYQERWPRYGARRDDMEDLKEGMNAGDKN